MKTLAALFVTLLLPIAAHADANGSLETAIRDHISLDVLRALEGGADPNATVKMYDNEVSAYIVMAPISVDVEATRYMLQYGGNPNLLDSTQENAVHKLVAYCPKAEVFQARTDMTSDERAAILAELFKAGAKFDSISTRIWDCAFAKGYPNRKGLNAFQMALLAGDSTILQAFSGLSNLPVNALVNDLSPLILAARSPAVVSWLLQQGADPNLANSKGETPLLAAILGDSPDSVAALLAKSADPNLADKLGETPLYLAVSSPHALAISQALLAGGAKADIAGPMSLRPLVAAAASGSVDLLKLLVANGASVSTEGPTAVARALLMGNDTVADELVSLGASVDGTFVADDSSSTPLVFAILSPKAGSEARVAALRYLASHHANLDVLNAQAHSPLMTLAGLGWLPELDSLIASGVKIDLVSSQETALTVALTSPHCDAADHLIASHADVNLPKPGISETAAIRGNCVATGTLQRLLAAGAKLSGTDVLHDAIEAKDATALSLLISANADLEALRYGETPLLAAISAAWGDGVLALLKAGANPNAAYYTTPALIMALQSSSDPASMGPIIDALIAAPPLKPDQTDYDLRTPLFYVKTADRATALLARGATVEFADSLGDTPLYSAASSNVPALVNVLLKAGAKPDHLDHNGESPMKAALYSKNAQILALFCRFGSTDPYCNPSSEGRPQRKQR